MPEPAPVVPEPVPLADLLAAAQAGHRILTGNRRLAQHLLQAYARHMQAAGQAVWDTPAIEPWTDWLASAWDAAQLSGALPPRLLLSPEQERHLWEQVVADSPVGEALLRPAPTARLAAEAYGLLHDWRLRLPTDEAQLNEDVRAFRDWQIEFDFRCEENGWLPACRLAEALSERPDALGAWIGQPVHLIGFEELVPAQRRLLAALAEAGGRWRWVRPAGMRGKAVRVALDDAAQEAAIVARWVRQRLEADPAARIGVVVPDLASRRQVLCRALDAVLTPGLRRVGEDARSRPYNVTLGLPLAEDPLVQAALQLLALATGRQPFEAVMRLLRSPYLAGWETEMGRRALLDRQLREIGEPHIGVARLRHYAALEDKPWHCPVLAERLAAMERLFRDWPNRARAGAWVQRFSALLQAAGWSRGRSLSSHEYQASEAWRRTLSCLASLETVGGSMTAREALARLRSLAAGRLFQPQSPPTPVQVMGLYEAIGAHFDHLWVMGLSDDVWPPSPRPNPFLPLALQRHHGLPHASESRELEVARRITERLGESAGEVIFSYAVHEEETARQASPLIAALPEAAWTDLGVWTGPDWAGEIAAAGAPQRIADTPPPPVPPGSIRGGSALFRLQAACPFRAFAEVRLAARPLGEVGIGIDAMTRGSLVHRVLQLVWERLGDHDTLCRLADEALQAQVRLAVEQAVEEMAGRMPQIFTAAFRRIESERLAERVLAWLAIEKRRSGFSVAATEEKMTVDIDGLQVKVVIDRVDRLPDGRRIVVDYKTGKVSPSAWFGERPDDPQLPLYATVLSQDLAGVVFAQLRPGEMGYQGVVAEADLVPDAKLPEKVQGHSGTDDWHELLAQWSATIHRLARAFRDSQTAVDPKAYPKTCRYCALTGLCRITEADGALFLYEAEAADG